MFPSLDHSMHLFRFALHLHHGLVWLLHGNFPCWRDVWVWGFIVFGKRRRSFGDIQTVSIPLVSEAVILYLRVLVDFRATASETKISLTCHKKLQSRATTIGDVAVDGKLPSLISGVTRRRGCLERNAVNATKRAGHVNATSIIPKIKLSKLLGHVMPSILRNHLKRTTY